MAEVGGVERIGDGSNQIPPVKPVAETTLDPNKKNPPNPGQSRRPSQKRKRPNPPGIGRIIDVEA